MTLDNMKRCQSDSAIGDVAYLTRSEHRVQTLVSLTDRPRSRSELCERTGVSSSTIRRTLGEFEDRRWVRKDGYKYTATLLGEAIASGVKELLDRVEAERALRDVWHWLPDEALEFAVDASTEATVTVAEYDSPYRPVNRFRSLLEEATQFRFVGVDLSVLEPCREAFRQQVLDGMQAEIIDPPEAASYILSTYPELCTEILESGNMTALLHDELPSYGVGIFDDRTAIVGNDLDSGAVKVLIDSDAQAAREWAEAVYASYREGARPLEHSLIAE